MAGEKLKPESNKDRIDRAYKETAAGVVDQTASVLKAQSKYLGLFYKDMPDLKDVPSEQFREMARSAIEKREFQVPNGPLVKLSELNEKMHADPAALKILRNMGVDNADKLVPTKDERHIIAEAGKRAVTANLSSDNWYASWTQNSYTQGLSPGNAITYSRFGLQGVAENFRNSTQKELDAVLKKDPGMSRFLTPENRAFMEQTVYDSVATPDKKAPDLITETKVKDIDEATRNNAGNSIYYYTYNATKKKINDVVDKGYEESFFGGIAKFLGPDVSNFFIGIINAIIGLLGGKPYEYIPGDREIHNASNIVAGSVRDVFTGDSVPQTPEDVKTAVEKAVRSDLEKHKDNYPSFSPERMAQIATQAGEAAKANYSELPKNLGRSDRDAKLQQAGKQYQESKGSGPATPDSKTTSLDHSTNLVPTQIPPALTGKSEISIS